AAATRGGGISSSSTNAASIDVLDDQVHEMLDEKFVVLDKEDAIEAMELLRSCMI
ncbi:hypothetical protein CU097_004054, partial [Rhizopus azygosporus]